MTDLIVPHTTPHDMLRIAVERGADMDQLSKFMDLADRWDANQARKAYVSSMTEFKLAPPDIVKRKQVAFGNTSYKHATLSAVTEAIIEGLAKHGFSHRWATEQNEGQIVVTCIITHRLGHSESTALKSSADQSGQKNNIQAIASTITYLQRYTLLAATGLATRDMTDDDGRGAEIEYITHEQAAKIQDFFTVIGEPNRPAFLTYMGVENVVDIEAKDFGKAIAALKKKQSTLKQAAA